MAKKSTGRKSSRVFRILYLVIFLLIALWFIISIVQKRNPLELLQGSLGHLSNSSTASLQKQIAQKDSIIRELENRLASYEGSQINRRALVIINTDYLNMRAGPTLESDILVKIPANAEVKLQYYDVNTYYIEGKSGRWAHILYAGQEGWVWGNYIREI